MTQPDLFTATLSRPRKSGRVPRSSVLAYQERPRDERTGNVVMALKWKTLLCPTSAELAQTMFERQGLEELLYVRRGLSDALAIGLVEHAGTRKCAVSGRQCVTWKVASR